jgi:phage terminase large subunit-like protein
VAETFDGDACRVIDAFEVEMLGSHERLGRVRAGTIELTQAADRIVSAQEQHARRPTSRSGDGDADLSLLPIGEKCRASRGDEGASRHNLLGASRTPSSGPSGHLLPAGEKREQGDEAPLDELRSILAGLPLKQQAHLLTIIDRSWRLNGRHEQQPPPGDWRTWLIMGGRGSGKTRAGAEWVQVMASGAVTPLRIALVAETLADAREVMVDGVSGLWRIARDRRPTFEISRRRLVWPNGSVAQLFSSEDPESLRGPQFDLAWCDELGKWKHPQETWDMLQFGLRLGHEPRQVVTTTPRAIALLKAIVADAGTVATRLSTSGNAGNLASGFIKAMQARYGGTRLGRQELDGELIEDREDALWNRAMLERLRVRNPGPLGRIVVAVDPPVTERAKNSCCGIVVAGLEASGRAAVLADLSVTNASPNGWGEAVVRAVRRFQADRVVAEINQGGDMVSTILRSIDANLPISTVRASRGKFTRAEPVAALYEQGRVVHAGTFPALEDQMCDFGPEGLSGGNSPDRMDALVWALTSLMLGGLGEPRVRGI